MLDELLEDMVRFESLPQLLVLDLLRERRRPLAQESPLGAPARRRAPRLQSRSVCSRANRRSKSCVGYRMMESAACGMWAHTLEDARHFMSQRVADAAAFTL